MNKQSLNKSMTGTLVVILMMLLSCIGAVSTSADSGKQTMEITNELIDSFNKDYDTQTGLSGEYIGDKTEAKVYEEFENDIWLQYQQKDLQVGDTADLRPWRVPQVISNPITNDVRRPNFHFEIVSGDSVSLSVNESIEKTLVKAEKPGTSVVKVTYDGMSYENNFFGPSSPENAAYAVYTVNQDGKIDLTVNDELKNWQHYNTVYYTQGDTVGFDFVAKAPSNTQVKVFVNGIEISGVNDKYTAQLENRNNIISVEATDEQGHMTSIQRIVAARFIDINQKNKTNENQELSVGDTATVSFHGIKMPVHKLATIYNPTFYSPAWGNPGTYVTYENELLGDFKGIAGQWNLATKNSFNVELNESRDYVFKSPKGIFTSWWGMPLGADLAADGVGEQDISADAPTYEGNFSKLPDFTISVKEKVDVESIKLNIDSLELNAGESEQLIATVTPESEQDRVVWSSSDEGVATVNETGLVETFKKGTTIITASIGDVKADVALTVSGDLFIPVKGIDLEFDQLGFGAGETKQLNYSVIPANATDQTPTFTSDNEKIAVVTPDGVLIGAGIGMTKVHIQIGDIKETWDVSFYLSYPIKLVFEAIDKIPAIDELTLEDKSVVDDARHAYKSLNENEQLVAKNEGKTDVLEAAEKRIKELENEDTPDPKPEGDDFVNLTIERFTIGQGFFQEPIKVPVTENEKVSEVVDRFMKDNGYDYAHSGTLSENYYLIDIDNADTGKVNIPSYIPDYLYGPTTEEALENGNNYAPSLGEFSYNQGAGWIYFLNNEAPNVGMADKVVKHDDVIRLQFTLVWGADLGDSKAAQSRKTAPKTVKTDDKLVFSNKDVAIRELATFNSSSDKEEKLKDTKVKKTYEELSASVEQALVPQKELDAKINDFDTALSNDPAENLVEYKNEKIKELGEYKDLKEYRKNEQEVIKDIIKEATTSIEQSTTSQGVDTVVTDTKQRLDEVKTDAQLTAEEAEEQAAKELEERKKEAIKEIDDYKNLTDYRQKEQEEIKQIKEQATKDIEKATTIEAVNQTVSATKEVLDDIKTDEQLTEEEKPTTPSELENYKKNAVNKFNKSIVLENYRQKEQGEIKEIQEQTEKSVKSADDKEAVDSIIEESQLRISQIKTDKELTEEEQIAKDKELIARKLQAIDEVRAYKKLSDYDTKAQQEIQVILEKATTAINEAKTIDEVNHVVAQTKEAIDKITPISEIKPDVDVAKELKEKTKLTTNLVAGVKEVSGNTLPNTAVTYEVVSTNKQGNKEKLQSESVISDDNGKFTLKIQEKLLEGDKVVFTFTKDKATYTLTETVQANKDVNDVSGKGDAGTPPPKKGGKGNSGNHSSSGNASGVTSSGGNRGTDNLPKTGESKAKLTVIGVVVLMSGAGVYIYNKRKLAK